PSANNDVCSTAPSPGVSVVGAGWLFATLTEYQRTHSCGSASKTTRSAPAHSIALIALKSLSSFVLCQNSLPSPVATSATQNESVYPPVNDAVIRPGRGSRDGSASPRPRPPRPPWPPRPARIALSGL